MASKPVQAEEIRNVDLEARIQIAKKVGRLLARGPSDDYDSAADLARLMVEDISVSVREALSQELKSCAFLPKQIVEKLSLDINQVSLPFLMASEAIDDSFLEMIVRESSPEKQGAIAQRQGLSEIVSFAICDVGAVEAVDVLLDNETAEMSERGFQRVVDRFPIETSLMEKLASKAELPMAVVERIVFKVSSIYSKHLTQQYNLSTDYASYLTTLATRQVFARTMDVAPLQEIQNYLSELHKVGGLRSDVILTYLQNKNVRLFLASVATLSGMSFEAVETRIGRYDRHAFSRILEKLSFSSSVAGVLLIAYDRLFRG